jgi:FixJ family two-component response regulator
MAERPLVAIVDDDQSLRNATRDLLKAAGFSTATFEDAESFLGSASRASAACLVADMRMPGMTGLELYQALVASGERIPTVIITAHPEELTQSRARDAGITCYLSKPFAPDDLLECVGEALAKSQRRPIPRS